MARAEVIRAAAEGSRGVGRFGLEAAQKTAHLRDGNLR